MTHDEIPDPTRIPCCECGYYWIVESNYRVHDGCDRPRKANEMTWSITAGWHRTVTADFSPNVEGHCPYHVSRRTLWQKLTGAQ